MKSFSALAQSLEEAQLEYPRADIKKYEECVKSLNTLAQYLNGLRSSCGLQYDMLRKDELRKEDASAAGARVNGTQPAGGIGGKKTLNAGMRTSSYSLLGSLHSDQDQSASADLIEFLDHVGKPMKSLALTCKLTIEHLQDIFTSSGPKLQRPRLQVSPGTRVLTILFSGQGVRSSHNKDKVAMRVPRCFQTPPRTPQPLTVRRGYQQTAVEQPQKG